MKIGLVGDATRTVAWENHLNPHGIVKEVILTPSLSELPAVDACFLLDESDENLSHLLHALQRGFHTFFVSRLPTETDRLDKIHRTARESNVIVQFAHWPSLAPSTQWIKSRIEKPTYIHINKEINHSLMVEANEDFRHYWIDELGFCIKLAESGLHHIEAKQLKLDNKEPISIQIFLRFDNGASATVNLYTGATEHIHKRLTGNKKVLLDCDVIHQEVREGSLNSHGQLFFSKKKFDKSKAAEKAALQFLKAVQMGKDSAFTSFDALTLAKAVEEVENRLNQFR